jgi:hypothetical protein
MRHHFCDFLDREHGYWTIIPNRERYLRRISDVVEGCTETSIVTVGKEDSVWEHVLTLPNLEELTLHEPTKEQLNSVVKLSDLKRLRITHARPKHIEFLEPLEALEELVLEYVSGFSDLSPLRKLERLRSLHIENLRRVSNFEGLSGVTSLQYLAISGTLDLKQPIDNFEFLRGLPNLEYLRFWQFMNKSEYPALLPALSLTHLKKLVIVWTELPTEEYALLEAGLPGVEGADWGPYRVWPDSNHVDWIEFTGKRAGRFKKGSAASEDRCREFADRYDSMKLQARTVIDAIE